MMKFTASAAPDHVILKCRGNTFLDKSTMYGCIYSRMHIQPYGFEVRMDDKVNVKMPY